MHQASAGITMSVGFLACEYTDMSDNTPIITMIIHLYIVLISIRYYFIHDKLPSKPFNINCCYYGPILH